MDAFAFDEPTASRILRAVRAVERMARGGDGPTNESRGPEADQWVRFKASVEIPPFGVFVDNQAVVGTDPPAIVARATQTLGERPLFLNGSERIVANGFGFCRALETRPVRVAYESTDGTPAAGEVWGPVPTTCKVRKGMPGFKILRAGAGGVAWAVWDQVEAYYRGKLKAGIAPGESKDVDVYYLAGSTWSDRAIDATVYAPPLLTSGSIASGKWVRFRWDAQSRRLEIVSAEC